MVFYICSLATLETMTYRMRGQLVLWNSENNAWHFIHLPKETAMRIRKKYGTQERGWSSLPLCVTIGKTTWETSMFYDKRSATYILPIKALVRKKEGIFSGDSITFSIKIML